MFVMSMATPTVEENQPTTATRPSLYALITLARMVQQFRERLKARVRSHRACVKPSEIRESLDAHALTTLSKAFNPTSIEKNPNRQRDLEHEVCEVKKDDLSLFRLFDDIESHAVPGDPSLRVLASDDRLFLKHHIHKLVSHAHHASHVFNLTTLLLNRLQNGHDIDGNPWRYGEDNNTGWESIDHEKFVANLEHLLLCLQQAALESLISLGLGILEAEIHHWYHCWQQQERFHDGFFTEWPSGRRPLSTTWPWNIKPSLVVLWGVCWMFYGSGANQMHERRESIAGRGEEVPQQQQMNNYQVGAWPTTRAASSSNNALAYQSGMQLGSQQQQVAAAAVAWPHAQPLGRSLASSTASHMSSCSPSALYIPASSNALVSTSPIEYRPSSIHVVTRTPRRKASFNAPAIFRVTPTTSSEAISFSSGPTIWSQTDTTFGISAPSDSPYDSTGWQPGFNNSSHISTTGHLNTPVTGNAPSSLFSPSHHHSSNSWSVPEGYDFTLPVPMQQPKYPSPVLSERSARASSVLSNMPKNLSEGGYESRSAISPTTDRSSPQDLKLNQDPPRNQKGDIYCNHPSCANDPPVFPRKCEWTKHMDKHTRPYKCDEPGCEKIQGFTYSGGLLRHKREVHKQHGGPKAPKMCPHRDCKRSTGTGFSRKENLQEHLRRVHRGVGIVDENVPPPLQPGLSELYGGSIPRKRRSTNPDHGDYDDGDTAFDELHGEIKRLRREGDEKDMRLRRLEGEMQEKDNRFQQLEALVNSLLHRQNLQVG